MFKFYFRVINISFILFPKLVNKCLVFDGFKIYITDGSIRRDLNFKEIKI